MLLKYTMPLKGLFLLKNSDNTSCDLFSLTFTHIVHNRKQSVALPCGVASSDYITACLAADI